MLFDTIYLCLRIDTSEESKERSKQVLEEIGTETKSSGSHGRHASHTTSVDTEGKNPDNVARGYKAYDFRILPKQRRYELISDSALSNPNVSEEAKERAEQKLEEMGAQ